jgi:hypothetical protein
MQDTVGDFDLQVVPRHTGTLPAVRGPLGDIHRPATPAARGREYSRGMSRRIPEPDPYDAQTGFDADWGLGDAETPDLKTAVFDAGEDEIDIEEDRARER